MLVSNEVYCYFIYFKIIQLIFTITDINELSTSITLNGTAVFLL